MAWPSGRRSLGNSPTKVRLQPEREKIKPHRHTHGVHTLRWLAIDRAKYLSTSYQHTLLKLSSFLSIYLSTVVSTIDKRKKKNKREVLFFSVGSEKTKRERERKKDR